MGTRIRVPGWYRPGLGTPLVLLPCPFTKATSSATLLGAGTGEPPGALREEETIHLCRSPFWEGHGGCFGGPVSPRMERGNAAVGSQLGGFSEHKPRGEQDANQDTKKPWWGKSMGCCGVGLGGDRRRDHLRLGWDMATNQANSAEYNRLFNRSLMRQLSRWGSVIATGGHDQFPVLFMRDNGACRFYDKAERDRQHALRRIQRRRARSIASWPILPLSMLAAMITLLCGFGKSSNRRRVLTRNWSHLRPNTASL
jgi:hypothetical protein